MNIFSYQNNSDGTVIFQDEYVAQMADRNPENNSVIQINSAVLELRASDLCSYYSDSVFDLEISDN